jgi:hypothetical protein
MVAKRNIPTPSDYSQKYFVLYSGFCGFLQAAAATISVCLSVCVSLCMFVCPSIHMIQFENCWMDLDDIWCGHCAVGVYPNRAFQLPTIGNTNVADE